MHYARKSFGLILAPIKFTITNVLKPLVPRGYDKTHCVAPPSPNTPRLRNGPPPQQYVIFRSDQRFGEYSAGHSTQVRLY